jgi:soluble lytic murein transglycosylase-like protein
VLGTVSPAAAQIYSWRDADGKLVVSDTPRAGGGAQTTYEVHGATEIKTTIPFASSHKSAPYDATINLHARRQGVAEDLVRAVIQVESAFNPNAVLEQRRDGPDAADAGHGARDGASATRSIPSRTFAAA